MLAFEPARRRLDRLAGKLVFGERPSHYETLEQLGRTLESAVDVEELAPREADTVCRAGGACPRARCAKCAPAAA